MAEPTTAPGVAPGAVTSAVRFDAVRKRFHGRTVLEQFDLDVASGECVALVGGNGAGKTTSLKILLDFQHADSGTVHIFGRDSRESHSRAPLAFLPERFVPPQHLSGWEFLRYMAELHGTVLRAGELESRLHALDFDAEALSRPLRAYSKGMAQKLGLAAVFASGRELLVLDEPMSGLDPKARILVRRVLKELRGVGHTVLFTTHALADVEALSDRLAILNRGRIAFAGSSAQCCARFDAQDLEDAYLACVETGSDPA